MNILNSSKQDNRFFSAELASYLGNVNSAIIVQQLHYWTQKETVGVLVDGVKYIYNSFKDWVQRQFQWLSTWQFRQAMKLLRQLGIVKVIRYQAKTHWDQTNYYSLNYDRLTEFINKHRSAESTEISEMCNTSSQGEGYSHLEVRDAHNSYIETKNTLLEVTAKQSAASSNDFQEKCDSSQVKGQDDDYHRPPQLNSLKDDLKVSSCTDKKSKGFDKTSAQVDEKINNKKWRSHLDELDDLGVKENPTIRRAVKFYGAERVKRAIKLYRKRKRESDYIPNPCGYFMQALKEDWAGKNSEQLKEQNQTPENKMTLFRLWFDIAREFGYCTQWEERDGDVWVLISGYWEKFTDAWERGYTLEYLKGVSKKSKNP